MQGLRFEKSDFMACCGSKTFSTEMAMAAPFSTYEDALASARDIWFNKVDVNGWLEALAAHPEIGQSPANTPRDDAGTQWSKGEQSSALATATDSSLQALSDWNARYRQKFGFVFLICASGRGTPEILSELKRRYMNRPIMEFEIAAKEQMRITEIRLAKLFSTKEQAASITCHHTETVATKAEDRVNKISAHLSGVEAAKPSQFFGRTRPPITTHVLDVAGGSPASGIDVLLERWAGIHHPVFSGETNAPGDWIFQGSSTTDKDGRSGQLMGVVDAINPGTYRISFNTGKYNPAGFFPFVSIVFEVREAQKLEHFHVPLLLSPFSFTTYRGS